MPLLLIFIIIKCSLFNTISSYYEQRREKQGKRVNKKLIEETNKSISSLKDLTKPISQKTQLGESAEWTPLIIKV